MNKIYCIIVAIIVVISGPLSQAKTPVTDLPDISVIGNFLGAHQTNAFSFNVNEIELSLQHYLHPAIKADVILGIHKESTGKHELGLEEAFLTVTDVVGVLFPQSTADWGVSAVVGKKLLGIGKVNPLHPEQWMFVDRPLIIKQVFGQEGGLSAEGGQLAYLLPTSFFSQVELGLWTASPHDHASTSGAHSIEYANRLAHARLWNSVALSDTNELEFGASYLIGNLTADSSTDMQHVVGLDVTYTKALNKIQSLTLQSEWYHARYGEEGEARADQSGGFIGGTVKPSVDYEVGLRYGVLSKHGDEGHSKSQVSVMASRQLMETSKLRLQYSFGEQVDNTAYIQFIFGMGPHAHVLQ